MHAGPPQTSLRTSSGRELVGPKRLGIEADASVAIRTRLSRPSGGRIDLAQAFVALAGTGKVSGSGSGPRTVSASEAGLL